MPVQKPNGLNAAIDIVLANEALELSKAQRRRLDALKTKNELPNNIGYGTIQLLLAGMEPEQYESFVTAIHENNPNFWPAFIITPVPAKLYDVTKANGKLDKFIGVINSKLKTDHDFSLNYLNKLGQHFRSKDDVEVVYSILAKPRVPNITNPSENNQRNSASRAKKPPVFVGFTFDELNNQARTNYVNQNPKKGFFASAWESVVRFFVPTSLADRWFPGNTALAEKLRGYTPPVAAEQPPVPASPVVAVPADGERVENDPNLNSALLQVAAPTIFVLTDAIDAVPAPIPTAPAAPSVKAFKPFVGGASKFKPVVNSSNNFKPPVSLSPTAPDKQQVANTDASLPSTTVISTVPSSENLAAGPVEALPETTPVKPSFKPADVGSARGFKPHTGNLKFKPPVLPASPTPETTTTVTITVEQRNLSPQDLQNMQQRSQPSVRVEELEAGDSTLSMVSKRTDHQLQLALQQASRLSIMPARAETPLRERNSVTATESPKSSPNKKQGGKRNGENAHPNGASTYSPALHSPARNKIQPSCGQEAARGLFSPLSSPSKIRI